jgi:hypothetical protein
MTSRIHQAVIGHGDTEENGKAGRIDRRPRWNPISGRRLRFDLRFEIGIADAVSYPLNLIP